VSSPIIEMIRRARQLALAATTLACVSACSLFASHHDESDNDRALPGEQPATQTVDPNLQRPEVEVKQIKPEDFEAGAYASVLVIDRHNAIGLYGARVAFHKTENLFVEGNYAFSSRTGFTQAASLFGNNKPADLDYKSYGFSIGYNLFPGDLYLTKNFTLPFVIYGIAGLGYAKLEDDNHTAYSLGGGIKMMPTDWLALRIEVRDQAWSVKGGGRDDNAEISFGIAGYF
jgi:outer membrane beta-barrel protein